MNRTEVEHNLKVGMYARRFDEIDRLLDHLEYYSNNKTSTKVHFMSTNGEPVKLWIMADRLINLVKEERAQVLQVYNEFVNGRQSEETVCGEQ